jgi:hypothetical protein
MSNDVFKEFNVNIQVAITASSPQHLQEIIDSSTPAELLERGHNTGVVIDNDTEMTAYDLDGGSTLFASVSATKETVTIIIDHRDAENLISRITEGDGDDRDDDDEALQKLKQLIDKALAKARG